MTRNEKINVISTTLLIGFCVGIFYHFIIKGVYLKRPGDFFCCVPFSDLTFSVWNAGSLMPYTHPHTRTISAYLPFSYMLMYPLSLINEVLYVKFIAFFIAMVSLFGNYYFLYKGVIWKRNFLKLENKIEIIRNLFIFSFLSYPFLWTMHVMNIEFIIFFFEILFLIFYLKGKNYTAATFLAFGAAMKIYPGVLLFFFLKDKKYKVFLYALIFAILINIISIYPLKGTLPEIWHGFQVHNQLIRNHAGLGELSSIYKQTTLLGIFQMIRFGFDLNNLISPKALFNAYAAFGFVAGLLLFYFLIKYETELWKIAFLLIAFIITFHHISFYHKAISLFIPLWLFINSKEKSKYDIIYTISFGLFLIPMPYVLFTIRGYAPYFESYGSVLIMLTFMLLIVKERFDIIKANNNQ